MDAAQQNALEARLARHRARVLPLRVLTARPRLIAACLIGAAAGLLTPESISLTTRALIGWNAGVLVYLVAIVTMMARTTRAGIPYQAKLADNGRSVILMLVCIAAVASVGAILFELSPIKTASGAEKALRLALVTSTILLSWAFIHTEFAVHYAHEFYSEARRARHEASAREASAPPLAETRGGLQFPDCKEPVYLDFVYFSFVIGVAAQTADVAVASRSMRAIVLAHSILCFFFNTTILALTINIAAGLVS